MSVFRSTRAGGVASFDRGSSGPTEAREFAGASSQPVRARTKAWVIGFAILLLGAGAGWVLESSGPFRDSPFVVAPGLSGFALLYVLAQALERLLEPIVAVTEKVGGPNKADLERERDSKVAVAINTGEEHAATEAAQAQADLRQLIVDRAASLFLAASGVAAAGLGYLNVQILDALGVSSSVGGLHTYLELIFGGLVVGGGTKPLHDLISRIEKANTQADTPSEFK